MPIDTQLTVNQAQQIAKLQTQFNQGLDADWPMAPTLARDDFAAVIVELGERYDHLGYKWWKKQQADHEQANMELIDVLHFAVSDVIEVLVQDGSASPVETAALKLAEASIRANADEALDAKWLLRHTALEGRPDLGRPLCFGNESLTQLFNMLYQAYGSAEAVYVSYVGKNALNHVRQQRGYKDGSYIKMWHDEEDNQVMMRLLLGNNDILKSNTPLDEAIALLTNYYDDHIA
ncbi:dUTPase-like protein [Idiomarina fontislapidosi]|uniref:dUTPase n=1 Tax=Idiomarina fontislapidosi TaxID=263723 RepID=A0A432Y9D4_9GAMM|nr:dUTPase [Idiomarina fontislapidosi]PYE34463.1 dUTPase-like protein [Idiomarina fontislapidosi]RUO57578.1 dUTPase [Idiomarina fontislapidosi]